MNILCIGDIVGKPGRDALRALLPGLKKEYKIDCAIVNAENTASGSGLTSRLAKQLFDAGSDCLTLGDHVWDQKELEEYLDETDRVIRPANFPDGAPGKGWTIVTTPQGVKIGVVNLLGRTFMRYQVLCPFRTIDEMLPHIRKETANIVMDMHAETTSEKVAMGHYVNGRVSVLFGTHTHIQTADEEILDQGTAYITDVGMTGPYDSVIGQQKERIIQRFLTSRPIRFQVAKDKIKLCGIVVSIDEKNGRAKSIRRVQAAYTPEEKPNTSDS